LWPVHEEAFSGIKNVQGVGRREKKDLLIGKESGPSK